MRYAGRPPRARGTTIASFKAILNGEYDELPEGAFYMVGGIDEVVEKAKSMQD